MSKIDITSFMNSVDNAIDAPVEIPFAVNQQPTKKLTIRRGRAKNFRSVGNAFLEFDYERNQSTSVTSDDNGQGKSTMTVWLPYFVLLDKPYGKKATKPSLVNTINNKDCVGELEFFTNGTEYKVTRGIKPAIFDICHLVDGKWIRIEDEAATADYQGYLLNILGLDKKSAEKILENVILLGLDKFHPFIEMGVQDRRIIVETIWDLGVFSLMNEDVGKKQASANRENELLIGEEQRASMSLVHAKERLSDFESSKTKMETEVVEKIEAINQSITEVAEAIKTVGAVITDAGYSRDQLINGLGEELDNNEEMLNKALKQVEDELSAVNVDEDELVIAAKTKLEKIDVEYDKCSKKLSDVKTELIEIGEKTKEAVIPTQEILSVFEEHKLAQRVAEDMHLRIPILEIRAKELHDLIDKDNKLLSDGKSASNKANLELNNSKDTLAILEKSVSDYASMTSCPTCHQTVEESAKQQVANSVQPDIEKRNDTICKLHTRIEGVNGLIDSIQQKIEAHNISLKEVNSELSNINSEIQKQLKLSNEKYRKYEELLAAEKRRRDNELTASVQEDFKNSNTDVLNAQAEQSKAKAALDIAKTNVVSALRTTKMSKLNVLKDKHYKDKTDYNKQLSEVESTISGNEILIERHYEYQAKLNAELKTANKHQEKILIANDAKLKQRLNDVSNAELDYKSVEDRITVNVKLIDDLKASRSLIGDKEIKADIIKQYLPFLNSKINEYLEALSIFVGFEIDENFEVSMNAPERKNQTLFSLSSGQRARINLAIMLAMREVGNLKSSIQCNLLTCDEIFECLSANGVEEAVAMMKHKFSDSNLFVVTQRNEEFKEHFENNIHLELRNGFTEIKK